MIKKWRRIIELVISIALLSEILTVCILFPWLWNGESPSSPEQTTLHRLIELQRHIFLYEEHFGKFPEIQQFEVELAEFWRSNGLSPSSPFIDGWGNYISYKFPGVRNKRFFDIWSSGFDARYNNGEGDDLGNWADGNWALRGAGQKFANTVPDRFVE